MSELAEPRATIEALEAQRTVLVDPAVTAELQTAFELHRKTGVTGQVAKTPLLLVGDEAGAAQAEAEASATTRERGLDWLPTPRPSPLDAAVSGRRSER